VVLAALGVNKESVLMRAMNVAWVGALLGCSCVSVATKTTYTEDFLRDDSTSRAEVGSEQFTESAHLDDEMVVLSIQGEETCVVKTTPVFHKLAHNERSSADGVKSVLQPRYTAFYGLAAVGLGVYGYADASNIAAQDTSGGTSISSIEGTGEVLIGIGAALLVVAIIDQIRLSDDDQDLGEVRHETKVEREACHTHNVEGEPVVLHVRGDAEWKSSATTNARGVARFALSDLPEVAFRGNQLELEATIGTASSQVALSEGDTASLLSSLEGDAKSRLVRDREAKRIETCDRQVATLTPITIGPETGERELDRLERNWAQAKTTCGDKWQAEYEQSLVAFHSTVEKTKTDRAVNSCHESAQSALSMLDQSVEFDVDDKSVGETVQQRCADVPDGAKLIGQVQDRIKRRVATRERAEKRAAKTAALGELFDASNAVALRVLVSHDADARSALVTNSNGAEAVLTLARHWIDQAKRGAVSQEQLCASRSMLQTVSLDGKWAELKRQSLSDGDPIAGNRAAKAMEACR
jgi:hypothetical protein